MNKPSWDDAPDWANYLAMDEDGIWYWFDIEPKYNSAGVWMATGCEFQEADNPIDSSTSLEKRP